MLGFSIPGSPRITAWLPPNFSLSWVETNTSIGVLVKLCRSLTREPLPGHSGISLGEGLTANRSFSRSGLPELLLSRLASTQVNSTHEFLRGTGDSEREFRRDCNARGSGGSALHCYTQPTSGGLNALEDTGSKNADKSPAGETMLDLLTPSHSGCFENSGMGDSLETILFAECNWRLGNQRLNADLRVGRCLNTVWSAGLIIVESGWLEGFFC
ncbi:hypothetical protein R1flu_020720 [Riccia fluitans]|uniref:Uncharacterized protein n=1 Tax=Riccia fluitans TaxID=41844 RepID=A0ABD1ZMB0_9MARC